jgi:hypothetical protein
MASTKVVADIPEALAPTKLFLEITEVGQTAGNVAGYTVTETDDWLYEITVPEACVGNYRVIAKNVSDTVVGVGYVYLEDTTLTYRVTSELEGIVDPEETTDLLTDIYNRVLKLGNSATMNPRPVMSGRLQTLIRGDSYLIENETSLDWNKTPVPGFVLEATTARFGMKNISTGECYVYDGQSVTLLEVEGEDDQWLVQIEFTETESLDWVIGNYSWSLDLVHDGVSTTIDRSSNYRGYTKIIDKETIGCII